MIALAPQIEIVIAFVLLHVLQIVDIWEFAQTKLNVPVIVNVLMRRVPVIAIATAHQQIVETILNVNVIIFRMFVTVI
jgi:hypothetical protein